MPNYQKKIVYLSDEQRQELFENGSITVGGQTIVYSDNDMYVTPQDEPVTDVQVNGTSVVTDGVANVPIAGSSTFGVAKTSSSYGTAMTGGGQIMISSSDSAGVKVGTNTYKPIVPSNQHESAFYGLAKAAGADMASSSNPIGTYTDAAKKAIRDMLGIPNFDSELIIDTTTTEDSEIVTINTDGNGLPFELRAFKLFVKIPASTTGTADYVTVRGIANTVQNTNYTQTFPTLKMPTAASALNVYEFEAFPGGMNFIRAAASSGFASTSSGMSTFPVEALLKSIKQIEVRQYSANATLIPSGTRILLYGIRI